MSRDDGTPRPRRTPAPGASGGTRARGARVLVVDDDGPVLDVAVRILDRAGYDVLRAEGGAEALRLAHEAHGEVDLLLTDVVMPEMSGREVAETLRESWPGLPVLFMSAYTEDEVILEGVRVAEVDFLSKPFSLKELVGAVERTLEKSRPDR